jgi:ADP-ribose pyrophosphatase YjhB (NUDIX family)
MEPDWLAWCRELQAMAQTGLTFTRDAYDRERYEALRELAARILAAHCATEAGRIETLFTAETGYATPKVDVRGAVFRDERILLVREILDDGRWTLPGGWADVNQSPSECVVREVREESGFETVARKLAAVWDRRRHPHPPHPFHIYKMFFLCDLVGGEARTSIETSGVDFFAEDDLPELSLGRTLAAQIHRMFEHYRNPDLPTDFD